MQHQHVTVIGAGTMGNGIAHVFAQTGREVTLVDVKSEILDRARSMIENNLARQVKKATLTEADAKATYDAAMGAARETRSKARQAVVDAEAALQAHSDATEKALGFPLQYEPVAVGGGGRTRL